jgi:hypothetical protein
MKYADEQIIRPQHEGGCDYGYGVRKVLVQNTVTHPKKGRIKVQLIHIGSAKHWGGIGAGRYYSSPELALYPSDKDTCKQNKIFEITKKTPLNKAKWEELAPQIFEFLGMGFDLKLISLQHTLLLDEEGELDGPPPRDPKEKVIHPRIESDTVYRVFHEDNKCRVAKGAIVKQGGGKITYRLGSGREIEKRTKQLLEEGGAGTPEEAAAAYLREYEKQRDEATERLQRAAESYSYRADQLAEAKARVEEMLKEQQ